jgi:hypothetical protein
MTGFTQRASRFLSHESIGLERKHRGRERHDRDQARAGQRIEDGFIVSLRNAASLAEADYPQTIELQWHTARLWQKE